MAKLSIRLPDKMKQSSTTRLKRVSSPTRRAYIQDLINQDQVRQKKLPVSRQLSTRGSPVARATRALLDILHSWKDQGAICLSYRLTVEQLRMSQDLTARRGDFWRDAGEAYHTHLEHVFALIAETLAWRGAHADHAACARSSHRTTSRSSTALSKRRRPDYCGSERA